MNYENFRKASKEASPKAKQYFTASTFAKLLHEDEVLSRINILAFFNYVMKKVWLQQTHVGISLYDVCGEGYLRETDLENYMLELIPTLCQLSVMESTFQTFMYVQLYENSSFSLILYVLVAYVSLIFS
uniref:Serine/threonine-protein phosphatase 2A regulatory subunit B'' subunit gamma n=1 Tax=Schistosoma japonicum TaxID=6182 RepID=Q5D8Z1_SCHJA|nr:unknown [Schistosoma japonicum]